MREASLVEFWSKLKVVANGNQHGRFRGEIKLPQKFI
jgi:hypothetical protein